MSEPFAFNEVELAQYSRHISLSGFGMEKQHRLRQARVLLVGAGGLGCPAGLYLSAAGVGTIGVIDFDRVERSNLQRQIAHGIRDIGCLKVDSLIETMRGINPLLTYHGHAERLSESNVLSLIQNYDLVLDGSDNFETRFLLADACYLGKVPLLQAAVYEYEAQLGLFLPDAGPCYRCVFESPPERDALAPCAEVGVLGVVPGTAGLMMATEAIKYLSGLGDSLSGQMLVYQTLNQTLRHIRLARNPQCPLCGENPEILVPKAIKVICRVADQPQADDVASWSVDVAQARQWLLEGINVLDVRESWEFQAGHLPKAIHLPLGQLDELALRSTIPIDGPLLVYCQRGQRSLHAVRMIRAMGYQHAYSLASGFLGWQEAQAPSAAH